MFDLRTQQEAGNFLTAATHTDWHMAVAFDEQRIGSPPTLMLRV
jgi:hypothetical protein